MESLILLPFVVFTCSNMRMCNPTYVKIYSIKDRIILDLRFTFPKYSHNFWTVVFPLYLFVINVIILYLHYFRAKHHLSISWSCVLVEGMWGGLKFKVEIYVRIVTLMATTRMWWLACSFIYLFLNTTSLIPKCSLWSDYHFSMCEMNFVSCIIKMGEGRLLTIQSWLN